MIVALSIAAALAAFGGGAALRQRVRRTTKPHIRAAKLKRWQTGRRAPVKGD